MKHVVFISNSFGSLYNFRYELISELLKEYKVTIVTPMEQEDYLLYEPWKKQGLMLVETNFRRRGKNPFQEIGLYRQYLKILNERKPDLVLSYTIKPNIYAGLACAKQKIPLGANITGLGTAFQKDGFFKKMIVFLYQKALKKAETIFFQNRQSMEVFEKHRIGEGKKILVPGSGINLEKFDYTPLEALGEHSFLYVARIMKEKGAEEFFYMAEKVKKKYPFVSFDVVGFCEEAYEEKIQQLEKEGILKSHGWQDNMLPFLKKAGCIIQPSYHEGLSNICLEGAAVGRPLLVSDIPGCRETIEEGKTGMSFPPGDKEALLSCVEEYLKLPFEKKVHMGEAGRKKMEEEFDRKKVIEIYRNEIERILKDDTETTAGKN